MVAKTVKVPNYTPEIASVLVKEYTENPTAETVKALAERFGKTTRSIIAKLSREGVYRAKEYVSKTGEKPVKKDTHADAIGAVLRLTEAETESLTKANKSALAKIFAALANSKPLENGEPRAGEIAPDGETDPEGEIAPDGETDPEGEEAAE